LKEKGKNRTERIRRYKVEKGGKMKWGENERKKKLNGEILKMMKTR
jgi:hypothetical protein